MRPELTDDNVIDVKKGRWVYYRRQSQCRQHRCVPYEYSHHADNTGVFIIEDGHHADNTVMLSEMQWVFSILTLQHRTVVYSVLTMLYCTVYLFSTVLFVLKP